MLRLLARFLFVLPIKLAVATVKLVAVPLRLMGFALRLVKIPLRLLGAVVRNGRLVLVGATAAAGVTAARRIAMDA